MASVKITKRFVDTISPPIKATIHFDSELKGFGIRVMPTGVASYIVEYRSGGGGRGANKKRMVIGRLGELTPDQARKLAQDKLAEVRKGGDPLADRQTKRKEIKLKELIEQWDAERPAGKRTGKPMADRTRTYTLARLKHHVLPILGTKRVSEIDVDDVNALIRRVSVGETKKDVTPGKKRGRVRPVGGEGAARKVACDLSIIMSYAVDRRIILANPVSAARKPRAGKRHDFLRPNEMASLGQALAAMEVEGVNKMGITIIRLLLLTGARPSEIESLRWTEVDLEDGCLRLAATKTGHSQRRLPTEAIEILRSVDRVIGSPWVFPATRGEGHFTSKKIWNMARARAGLPDRVRYHARHAVASMALSEGHDIASVAAIMGHSGPRTTLAVYAHVLDGRAARAADDIGSKIAAAMAKKLDLGNASEKEISPKAE